MSALTDSIPVIGRATGEHPLASLDPPAPAARVSPISIARRHWQLVRERPLLATGIVLAVIGTAAVDAVMPLLLREIFDSAVLTGQRDYLWLLGGVMAALIASQGIAWLVRAICLARFDAAALRDLRMSLVDRLLAAPGRHGPAEVDALFNERLGVLELFLLSAGPRLIAAGATIAVSLLVLAYLDVRLVGMTLILIGAIAAGPVQMGRRFRGLAKSMSREQTGLGGHINDIATQSEVIAAFDLAHYWRERFAAAASELQTLTETAERFSQAGVALSQLGARSAQALVMFICAYLLLDGTLSTGGVAGAMLCLINIVASLGAVGNNIPIALRAAESATAIEAFLAQPLVAVPSTREPLPPLETLELRGVSFTYPGREGPALDDVTLTLRAGETVAMVGPQRLGQEHDPGPAAGLHPPRRGAGAVERRRHHRPPPRGAAGQARCRAPGHPAVRPDRR